MSDLSQALWNYGILAVLLCQLPWLPAMPATLPMSISWSVILGLPAIASSMKFIWSTDSDSGSPSRGVRWNQVHTSASNYTDTSCGYDCTEVILLV